jgi:hypothetical protein
MTPLEEDQQQVVLEMKEKGYDDTAIAQAREVTDAAGQVMASHFTSGYEQLAAAKRRYAGKPWLARIEGEFTGPLLSEDEADLRRTGAARYDNLNIVWTYDAVAAIRALDIPQLWVLAGDDREAPNAVTRQRLADLKRQGRPIELYLSCFRTPTMACTNSCRRRTARARSPTSRKVISASWPIGFASRTSRLTARRSDCTELGCATGRRKPAATLTHELAPVLVAFLRSVSLITFIAGTHHVAAAGQVRQGACFPAHTDGDTHEESTVRPDAGCPRGSPGADGGACPVRPGS